MKDVKAMQQRLKAFAERIDSLSLRERGIIFIGGLILLYLLADTFALAPLVAQKKLIRSQITAKQQQIIQLDQQVQTLVTGRTGPATGDKRARLDVLRRELAQLDTAVERATSGLVPPKEMARMVERVLARNRSIEVTGVRNLPPIPLLTPKRKAVGKSEAKGPLIYKHGLEVRIRGRYQELVGYLQQLEGLPWKVFWGKIALASEGYPVSSLTLVLYTLSLEEKWIGT